MERKQRIHWLTALVLMLSVLLLFPVSGKASSLANDYNVDVNGNLISYRGAGGNITLPDNVKKINKRVFAGNKSIITVTMPDSVEIIDNSAFDSCSALEKVTFSKKLQSIGSYAFWGCTALYDAKLPESLDSIKSSAFANCPALLTMYVPGSVDEIGQYAIGYKFSEGYEKVVGFAIVGDNTTTVAKEYATKNNLTYLISEDLKVSLTKLKKVPGTQLKVSWKSNEHVDGYEIEYATTAKFAKKNTKKLSVIKETDLASDSTLVSIAKKKTYYVRIRGYRMLNGKKFTSAWSKAKKIKIK